MPFFPCLCRTIYCFYNSASIWITYLYLLHLLYEISIIESSSQYIIFIKRVHGTYCSFSNPDKVRWHHKSTSEHWRTSKEPSAVVPSKYLPNWITYRLFHSHQLPSKTCELLHSALAYNFYIACSIEPLFFTHSHSILFEQNEVNNSIAFE